MKRWLLAALIAVQVSVAHAGPAAKGRMSDHFHWRPAANAVGWVMLLPGSGGLKVLDDDRHYFAVAERLNAKGWSVLLVDYKPAFFAAGDGPKSAPTGGKIAWVAERAAAWARQEHPETAALPCALAAWSLGAEGALRVLNDDAACDRMGVRAGVLVYPSNQERLRLETTRPTLVLTGAADDVIRVADVESLVRNRTHADARVELKVYPGAVHGFDVASLVRRRTVRILPWIGPKATLQYDEAAAKDAAQRLDDFLAREGGAAR